MYLPAHFEETRRDVLHALLRAHPLATLVTLTPEGLDANHLPFYLDADAGVHGTLLGHVARQNPLCRQLADAAAVLAVFQGPEAYVSPSWYPAKQAHGRVVPTWNYVAVHVHGRLRFRDEPAWLERQLALLTQQQEAGLTPPWAVADAPADFLARMRQAIVGVEIVIERMTGKWKVSQNQPAANREGAAAALAARGQADMAALIREFGTGE